MLRNVQGKAYISCDLKEGRGLDPVPCVPWMPCTGIMSESVASKRPVRIRWVIDTDVVGLGCSVLCC